MVHTSQEVVQELAKNSEK